MKTSVGAQFGDSRSDRAVNPYRAEMRKALDDYLRRSYFKSICEIGFVLRVTGSIWQFHPAGVGRLRHAKLTGLLSIELVLGREDWDGVRPENLRTAFCDLVEGGLLQVVRKTKASGELLDEIGLMNDSGKVIQQLRRGR